LAYAFASAIAGVWCTGLLDYARREGHYRHQQRRIGTGIGVRSRGEIARLADAFQTMARNVRDALGKATVPGSMRSAANQAERVFLANMSQ